MDVPTRGVVSTVAEPFRLSDQGADMADKSPRQHMSKKSGKSLKEKRAQKQAKSDGKNAAQSDQIENLLHRKR